MAHQTATHVVHQTFDPEKPDEIVTDPACGMKINRHDSKHMVFRGEETHYFCSRECKERFISPEFRRKKSA